MKHFTLESASLHSIPEKNVLNSQTFYFSILFERPFLSALEVLCLETLHHQSFVFYSQFISIAFIHTSHLLHISPYPFFAYIIAPAEYFLIPDDAVDRRKLGFQLLLFKQQFKASLEQFYIVLIMLLKDNMNRLSFLSEISFLHHSLFSRNNPPDPV